MTGLFSKFMLWGAAITIMATILISPAIYSDERDEIKMELEMNMDIEDFELARRLVLKGIILPLDTLLNKIGSIPTKRLLEVELENDAGRWIYELEILKENGEVIELQYDAASGQYLGQED